MKSYTLLEDVKLPNNWVPIQDIEKKFKEKLQLCHQFAKENGFADETSDYYNLMNETSIKISIRFYPNISDEEFIIAYLHFGFFIYCDVLSDDLVKEENDPNGKIRIQIEKLIKILMDGEVPVGQLSIPEKLGILLRKKIIDYSNKYNISSMNNIIWSEYIEFIQSFDAMNNYKITDIDSYLMIRSFDIGSYSCFDLCELFYLRTVHHSILNDNYKFRRARYLGTGHISIINDILSYEKELNSGFTNNSISFLQKKRNMDFDGAYQYLISELNKMKCEIVHLCDSLIQELSLQLNKNEMVEIENSINCFFHNLGGNVLWSCEAIRYASKNSIFKELKTTYQDNIHLFKGRDFIKQ